MPLPNAPRHWLVAPFAFIGRLTRFLNDAAWAIAKFAFGFVLLVVGLFSLANILVSTPRTGAYRTLHPNLPVCQQGLTDGWTVLADYDPALNNVEDDNGWVDPSNDETQAVRKDPAWATKLRCSLQKHVVPSKRGRQYDLTYHLGFLEFQETGEPYALVAPGADGADAAPARDITNPPGGVQMLTQLDALRTHLSQGSNYVVVFIHGWRNNASIGNGNVADLRHYAAHAARFLKRRCELERRFCDMHVTAIYVGWRGARVDEVWTKRVFGRTLGGVLGTLAAAPTLFDRKPVSEQVAPGAISALRSIERTLSQNQGNGDPKTDAHVNRMIVFGHSLGGNMLATGLEDDLIKLVREHDPAKGKPLPPILGDLTVLINPASEASKWTAVQREVWSRIPFHVDSNETIDDVAAGHRFFPADQKPVIVSVTSALAFPPAGYRKADCEWFAMNPDQKAKLYDKNKHGDKPLDYDWATQDLFPTFKFDFRPLAQRLQRWQASIEGRPAPGLSCDFPPPPGLLRRIEAWPARVLASLAYNFPFQTFDQEESHTIGHLDPPRPADGLLTDLRFSSGAPFGTTHELFGLKQEGEEKHNPYATLADAPLDCEPANGWLARARANRTNGTFWDSADLAPPADPTLPGQNAPAARFLHGADLAGAAAITRANDPFWNMRAFDNALARHDGYRLSSFICAMNQLVMDDITGAPTTIPSAAIDPTQGTHAK